MLLNNTSHLILIFMALPMWAHCPLEQEEIVLGLNLSQERIYSPCKETSATEALACPAYTAQRRLPWAGRVAKAV